MKRVIIPALLVLFAACQNPSTQESTRVVDDEGNSWVVLLGEGEAPVKLQAGGHLDLEVTVPTCGRYRVTFDASGTDSSTIWLEDYMDNTDGRTYNITGSVTPHGWKDLASIDGSPLDTGLHPMRLHVDGGAVELKSLGFELIQERVASPNVHVQNMEGDEWELVWSDEFDGTGLPDSTKWSYNIGNWGWGNNEPQYYTDGQIENARQENGTLIIEAHQNEIGPAWTSARLTTQGRHAFQYGKVEFRAKVPPGRGTWAAGWLLGEAYRDEISWPYCGEIDVLECVGYEINDTTGTGLNHATCHTRAYYFKQGNQIGSEIEVDSMYQQFHNYTIEWHPDRIDAYLDGEYYFTYDKNANELEWPFDKPQNIIVNLAVGGGWGGAQGIDTSWKSHQYILDYVRVYQKVN
ncbi:glycoside hydrolase family 16 protein [Cryomorphaceae bacterium]|nr:glycoside hydrolase family 16 protein [Cryomorphaceae bacterium]